MTARPWPSSEEVRLRSLYPTTPKSELVTTFGRSSKAISSRAKLLGLRKKLGYGGKIVWTRKDDRKLRSLYPDHSGMSIAQAFGYELGAIYQRAARLGLKKSKAYMDSPAACRLRRGDNVGAAFRYPKGHVPANKGMRRPGWSRGRMAETQFKKGQASINTMPLWTFRFNTDGYLLLKTGRRGPKPMDGWEYVHRLVWEQANGPLPDWREARLWWKDGDHGNCSLTNLELVTAAEHMRRTTIHNFPPELRQVMQLRGVLNRKIREAGNGNEKQDVRSAQPSI